MASSEDLDTRLYEVEEHSDDNIESDEEYTDSDDDDDDDYSYTLEEANSKLSILSIKNKLKRSKITDTEVDISIQDVDADAIDDYLDVQKIITAGKLEKLKVEQCKTYLRKNGLRLSGNKDTLIQRIKEHLEILNGGGQKKYPVSSFILNCKGDACTGDVVMFEQKVYEMFNIASRSSVGPCGMRTVAGRIVKESYGASKQQHTFTIEVLWSNGDKPLPPLHPLLIKGRNLYRMKTLRQRWEDERERQKVLDEKHERGAVARSNRETRVLKKENRKALRDNRIPKKEVLEKEKSKTLQDNRLILRKESSNNYSSQPNLSSAVTTTITTPSLRVDPRTMATVQHQKRPYDSRNLLKQSVEFATTAALQRNFFPQGSLYSSEHRNLNIIENMKPTMRVEAPTHYYKQPTLYQNPSYDKNRSSGSWDHRMPLNNMISNHLVNQPRPQRYEGRKQQPCHHYAKGRCRFGENCRFFHDTARKGVQ